jgi:uncharacterized membrane protein HdeD (DUF308 family)
MDTISNVIQTFVICGSVLLLAFLILLSLPASRLRCVVQEVVGWVDDVGAVVVGVAAVVAALSAQAERKRLEARSEIVVRER